MSKTYKRKAFFFFSFLVSNKIITLKRSSAIFYFNRNDIVVFGGHQLNMS